MDTEDIQIFPLKVGVYPIPMDDHLDADVRMDEDWTLLSGE